MSFTNFKLLGLSLHIMQINECNRKRDFKCIFIRLIYNSETISGN
jgi:hypothetical protein